MIEHQSSLFVGFTPLHAAVMCHNAVVKEISTFESPCSYMAKELAQRRQMYIECIKTLLFMGASYGTKVNFTTNRQHLIWSLHIKYSIHVRFPLFFASYCFTVD